MNAKPILITAISAALLILTGCATKREVAFRIEPGSPVTDKKAKYDYSNYAKIPDTFTGLAYGTVLKVIPYTKKRAFRGNWAGSAWGAGRPIDAMDEIFRRHDIAYAEARSSRTLRWADAACVEALQQLDPKSLSPEALAFRDRSSTFFTNKVVSSLGKPVHAFFYQTEAPDCPLQSKDDVRQLYGLTPKNAAPPQLASAASPRHPAKKAARHHGRSIIASSKSRPVRSGPKLDPANTLAIRTP